MFFSHDARSGNTRDVSIPNIADNYSGPNVSQYGWTTYETKQVNQLVQYVEMARQFAEQCEASAKLAGEVSQYLDQVLIEVRAVKAELDKNFSQFNTWYTDISKMYTEIIATGASVKAAATQVANDRVAINDLKNLATAAASASALSAAAALVYQEGAGRSATKAAESETGSKNWYDKSYELYLDLKSGQVYRGIWDPQTNAYPDNGGTNSTWDVVLTGVAEHTFDGKIWKSGQRLIYVQVDNLYTQVDTASGVETVNGKKGAVVLVPSDLGLITLAEMDDRYVSTRKIVDSTTNYAYSVIHLCPIAAIGATVKRSMISGTVEIIRVDHSGQAPISDRLELNVSSVGTGVSGSLLDDSGGYKLVTYSYNGVRWIGLGNKIAYPSCEIYFRGITVRNPDYAADQFEITPYFLEPPGGTSSVLNSEIHVSISDFTSSRNFYADNYQIYTKKNKPTADEINALSTLNGGIVSGDVSVLKTLRVGSASSSNPTIGALISSNGSDKVSIQTVTSTGSSRKLEFSNSGTSTLDEANFILTSEEGFKINGKPLKDVIPSRLPMFETIWVPSRDVIPDGCVPSDGQVLTRTLFADAWKDIEAGKVPKVTEDVWLSTPAYRGCYTEGDGSTTFRIPDYNGKTNGSRSLFLRGDGAGTTGMGYVQGDAIRNIKGGAYPMKVNGQWLAAGSYSGAFQAGNDGNPTTIVDVDGYSTTFTGGIVLDASRVVPTADENRPVNTSGVWCIRLFNAIVNEGAADAAALATAVGELSSEVQQLKATVPWTPMTQDMAGPGYLVYPNECFWRWDKDNVYIQCIARWNNKSALNTGGLVLTLPNHTGKGVRSSYLPCTVSVVAGLQGNANVFAGHPQLYTEKIDIPVGADIPVVIAALNPSNPAVSNEGWVLININLPLFAA